MIIIHGVTLRTVCINGSRRLPFHMPTRLAAGLGFESSLDVYTSFAPLSEETPRIIGSPASGFIHQPKLGRIYELLTRNFTVVNFRNLRSDRERGKERRIFGGPGERLGGFIPASLQAF